MPKITAPAEQATLVTSIPVSALRAQNQGADSCSLQVSASSTVPPASWDDAVAIAPGAILAADLPVAELWPGTASAYIWARGANGVSLSVAYDA
ncbi:MAG: hypothetical protein ACK5JR_06180 [Tropicimonas sp.]|uniref:hypothetical protein n=1 Tax=Tropicimonas sp. TaxID=2067044 RepID=UPI003A8B89AD